MNILFVFNIAFDKNGASVHLLKDVVTSALKNGHNCHVISKRSNNSTVPVLEQLKENYSLLKLDYVDDVSAKKGGFVKRYFNECKYAFKCKKFYAKNSYDVVFVQSCNTLWAQLVNLKKLKCPIVFNVQDIFPQNLKFSNQLPLSKITYPFFSKLQLNAYKKVSKIITISYDMKQTLVDLGVDENKINVVYNWSYSNEPISLSDIDKSNIYNLNLDSSKLNVVYAGNVGKMQNVELIANVAKKYSNDNSIHYFVLGDGANKKHIEQIVEGLNNVTLLPMQEAKYAESIYAQADVNIIPLVKGGIKTALPSKTATVLRTNSKIVFCIEKDSIFASFIKTSNNVYVADNGSEDELYNVLLKVKNNNVNSGTDKNVLSCFSTENADKYVKVLEEAK